MESIPILDLATIVPESKVSKEKTEWNKIASEFDRMLSGIGFIYLKNHGVSEQTIENAFKYSKNFFEQSHDTKIKYKKSSYNDSKTIYGYNEPNQERLDPTTANFEYRESFDCAMNAKHLLRKPHPDSPGFHEALEKLCTESLPLIKTLFRLLATAMKIPDKDFFINNHRSLLFEDPMETTFSTFRSIYYPAIPVDMEIKPGTVRCAQHSDYGILTLLFQDNMGGLEVKSAAGNWVSAIPIPGTILVNTGDLLYFWSSMRYPATVHRVLIPESEIIKRHHRQSMTLFVHPDDSTIVNPLFPKDPLVIQQPVSAYEHAKMKLNVSYEY